MNRRTLKQLRPNDGPDPELLTIYRDGNGAVPDISRLQIYRVNWVKRLLLVFVIGAGISLAAFWAFGQLIGVQSAAEPTSLGVTVEAPAQLASGETVTYRISYRNLDRVALQDLALTIRYPEGFTFLESEPASVSQFHNSWQLATLEPGAGGVVSISGKMVGAVGGLKTLAGTASYQPKNISARFANEFSHTGQITSSIMVLELSGPEKVIPEHEIGYTIEYANTSEQELSGVLVQLDYPSGFLFREADPAPKPLPSGIANFAGLGSAAPNSRWYVDRLPPNARETIVVRGGFSGGVQVNGNPERTLAGKIGFVDEAGGFSLQQEQRFISRLVEPKLQLTLIVNGQSTDQPVNFGETLNYRIVYKNLGQEALGDVAVEAVVTSTLVDWATLVDKNLGKLEATTLRWDKSAIAALGQLNPLAEGTIDFSLQLKNAAATPKGTVDFTTLSTARAVIGAVGDLPSGGEVRTAAITNRINTSLELTAEGRYFDDDNIAVGSGPLPPVVDETTTFRVYWSLQNSLHEATRVVVTTKLAPDVAWVGKSLATTGQLTYQAEERLVTWSMATLPPETSAPDAADDDEPSASVWFDISVTPRQDQVGKLLLLTSEANLSATDAVTNATIVGLRRSITSNLEDDPFGGGRGLVVEIGQ